MAVEVVLPKVDMDMSSAVISRWHVKDGETVKKGQAIFDIETDKAAMEIEAPSSGIIKLVDLAGAKDIAIGTVVAMIYDLGEELKAPPASAATSASVPDAPATIHSAASRPLPRNDAAPAGIRATPLARRLARQARIDLTDAAGSGPRGRIVAADVRMGGTVAGALPVAGARHFHLSATCNGSSLLALQQRLNAHAPLTAEMKPEWQLSTTEFIVKALATALAHVPLANVALSSESNLLQKHADIAVAVLHDAGMVTSFIGKAESKSLSAISLEMRILVDNAGARKPNLGGGFINMPQAVVLSAGAPVESYVAVAGQPVLVKRINITLTCDHRAIDVSTGARLLASVKRMIEEPALMLL
jgi:pyruvate dehydrogenase E2 component (dihydrolipoamide acetyltransferase)